MSNGPQTRRYALASREEAHSEENWLLPQARGHFRHDQPMPEDSWKTRREGIILWPSNMQRTHETRFDTRCIGSRSRVTQLEELRDAISPAMNPWAALDSLREGFVLWDGAG